MVNRDDAVRPSEQLLMPADLVGVPNPDELDPLVSVPIPELPVMSAQDAGKVLCELFLTNAERGNNAVNDELVAELVHRIRTAQHSRDHHNSPPPPSHPTAPTPTGSAHHD